MLDCGRIAAKARAFILAVRRGSSMDDIRAEFWEAMRHLFPPNAVVIALARGDLLISWKTEEAG